MEACCEDLTFRAGPIQLAPSLEVFMCLICFRHHYEATLDPGVIGLEGKGL